MKRLVLIVLIANVSFAYQAQTPQVKSPEVHDNGAVTFRYYDPDAHKVAVSLAGAPSPYVMTKGPDGVWSFTSPVLTPELYGYSFEVDGRHCIDPHNTEISPNLLSLSNVVHVPGPSPMPWEDNDIPHGVIHHHFYRSAIIGDNRDFYVYTPPGYDAAGATKYPVLYLLHGYSDDASGWTAVGKANLVLDTLISEGKAKPMIIVMPLGYGAPEFVQPAIAASRPFNNVALREKNFTNFQAALIDEVMPMVETSYKIDGNRDSRAIAGLSMGGAESLLTGLNRLDKFSWVGSFSAGGLNGDPAVVFPQLSENANSKLHLLWIACGTDDHLITANRNLVSWLKGKNIHLTQIETPGRHTWMVWRRNLLAFAPLLFQASSGDAAAPTPSASK